MAKKIIYSGLLKDPRWQKLRLKIMERADFACEICKDKEKTLHIHHRYYKSNFKPWDYPDESLLCLCENCHYDVQYLKKQIKNNIDKMDLFPEMLNIIGGFIKASMLSRRLVNKIKIEDSVETTGICQYFNIPINKLLKKYANKNITFVELKNFKKSVKKCPKE